MATTTRKPARRRTAARRVTRRRSVSVWQRLRDNDNWVWLMVTSGVVLETIGLGVDTLLHRLDPKLPLHDAYSLANAWHALLVLGALVLVAGVAVMTVISIRREGSRMAAVLGAALLVFGLVVAVTALTTNRGGVKLSDHGHSASPTPARSAAPARPQTTPTAPAKAPGAPAATPAR